MPLNNKVGGLCRTFAMGLPPMLFIVAAHVAVAELRIDPAGREVLERIESLNPHLVDGEIPNLSLKVMSLHEGPYGFFRGTSDLFYDWCQSNCGDWLAASGTQVLLHGDVHPGNTGTFVALPDGGPRLAYSLVDFDEAFRGPFELDLLRAATSLRFAAAENGLALSDAEWRKVIETLVGAYRETWASFESADTDAKRSNALHAADQRVNQSPLVKRLLAKADAEDAAEYINKYTKGKPPNKFTRRRGKKKKPKDIMLPVSESERKQIVSAFHNSILVHHATSPEGETFPSDAKVLDVVRWVRIGSSGSQGLRKYLVLLEGPKHAGDRPSIFQLKEEPTPGAIRAGLADSRESASETPRGRFVAESYALLQARPRRYVGWTELEGRSYLVKPKDAFGKEPDTEDLASLDAMLDMADVMGRLVGIGHAKSQFKGDATALRAAIVRDGLVEQVDSRSAACLEAFMGEYASFRADARARELAGKAEAWLKARG